MTKIALSVISFLKSTECGSNSWSGLLKMMKLMYMQNMTKERTN